MSAPSIAPLVAVVPPTFDGIAMPSLEFASSAVATRGFADSVASGLEAIQAQLRTSDADLRALAAGEGASLHHVMIRLEESRVAFQLMLQVRNRLLESYQEVMRMQV